MFNKLKFKKYIDPSIIYYGGRNMDKHWVIDKIEKLEIKNKDNDIVVISFNPDNIDLASANMTFEQIKSEFPKHNFIGKISNVYDMSVKNIDYLINELQNIKEEKLNENIY